jgi:hypothetical protein
MGIRSVDLLRTYPQNLEQSLVQICFRQGASELSSHLASRLEPTSRPA